MFHRQEWFHDLGRLVYGLAGIVLGVIGLLARDFAAVWQPIENFGVDANREMVACIYAAAFLAAGVAAMWRRTAGAALLVLAALHFISALGWIPRIIGQPDIYGVWNGFFELFSLVIAGVVAYAAVTPSTARTAQIVRVGRVLFGVCAISFAVGHFTAITETAGFVPDWLPPGQRFWAWATGVFHLLAGLALVAGVCAALAARLLTTMMLGFGVLVWLPILLAKPVHFSWAGTAITLALASAAWVIADSQESVRR